MNKIKLFIVPLLFMGHLLCMQDYAGAGGSAAVNKFADLPNEIVASIFDSNFNLAVMAVDKRFNCLGDQVLKERWSKLKGLSDDNLIPNIISCMNLPEKVDSPRYSDFEKIYKCLWEMSRGLVSSLVEDLDPAVVDHYYQDYLDSKIEDMTDIDSLLDFEKEVIDQASQNSTQITTVMAPSSVLSVAVRSGFLKVVNVLLDKGADVNAFDGVPWFTMPLLWAAMSGDLEMVELLVERGADVEACNECDWFSGGLSAYDIAEMNNHLEVMEYLVSQGATT